MDFARRSAVCFPDDSRQYIINNISILAHRRRKILALPALLYVCNVYGRVKVPGASDSARRHRAPGLPVNLFLERIFNQSFSDLRLYLTIFLVLRIFFLSFCVTAFILLTYKPCPEASDAVGKPPPYPAHPYVNHQGVISQSGSVLTCGAFFSAGPGNVSSNPEQLWKRQPTLSKILQGGTL